MPRMKTYWLGLAAVMMIGCGFGSTGSIGPDFGFEPDPVPGGGGSGSGSGGYYGDGGFGGRLDQGFGSPDAGVQANSCPETERRCAWEFVYSGVGNESTVEVLGDYRPNGFVVGDPLVFTGQSWRTAVTIPWNTQVLYKFHIVYQDQTQQTIPDPLNPRKVDDGSGGFNSVIPGITCAQWICPGG
ncbi:MAG TPA: hypothetical protein VH877_14315 [Polyangia bacterium]|nr:hypothetical protein [Polyangia bacterium]